MGDLDRLLFLPTLRISLGKVKVFREEEVFEQAIEATEEVREKGRDDSPKVVPLDARRCIDVDERGKNKLSCRTQSLEFVPDDALRILSQTLLRVQGSNQQ